MQRTYGQRSPVTPTGHSEAAGPTSGLWMWVQELGALPADHSRLRKVPLDL